MKNSYSKLASTALLVVLIPLAGCIKTPEKNSQLLPTKVSAYNVEDIDVTTNVKVALMNDPILKGLDINVITTKGDVRLIGIVDTQDQIDTIIKLAENADGTHAIHDELTIKP
jgi:hyperosmotically inducible periplasmic protein